MNPGVGFAMFGFLLLLFLFHFGFLLLGVKPREPRTCWASPLALSDTYPSLRADRFILQVLGRSLRLQRSEMLRVCALLYVNTGLIKTRSPSSYENDCSVSLLMG